MTFLSREPKASNLPAAIPFGAVSAGSEGYGVASICFDYRAFGMPQNSIQPEGGKCACSIASSGLLFARSTARNHIKGVGVCSRMISTDQMIYARAGTVANKDGIPEPTSFSWIQVTDDFLNAMGIQPVAGSVPNSSGSP
jgi:hypothetical protein